MSATDSPAAPPAADQARIAASVDHWKRKLLDLSKRNRALNFRMTRVSTLAIVDEQPAEVFRRLYLQGKPMRFRAAAEEPAEDARTSSSASADEGSVSVDGGSGSAAVEGTAVDQESDASAVLAAGGGSIASPDTAAADPATTASDAGTAIGGSVSPSSESRSSESSSSQSSSSDVGASSENTTSVAAAGEEELFAGFEEEDGGAASPSFSPYEASALHARHRDDELQTTAPPELLDKSLRRIDEQARETLEEQGVNALFLALGVLHYRDSKEDEKAFRAPLVLLPVTLRRKSAAAGYTVEATDDDPIVNPALAEYLKRTFGLALPELPGEIGDDYDLQAFLTAASESVVGQQGWVVTTEVYLGLFAFQKFVMYRDLEANGGAYAAHRLITQLVTRTGGQVAGLPDDVRELELDRDFPPERTFQVVDADGSQLRAIAAVAKSHDLVLEGPPGTGKSQTITNLIAQALAAGKSVLFVAEKMAALQVVHDRLVRAGLGDFCLELHSTKANKRAVLKEIARSLDATLQRPRAPESDDARLDAVRRGLSGYVDAVHQPYGALAMAPYRGFGELAALRDAPRIRLEAPIDGVTRDQLDAAVRNLEDLAKAVVEIGDPAAHPWRDSTRTLWSEADREHAADLLRELRMGVDDVIRIGGEAAAAYGLPATNTLADAKTALHVASVIARSPGAPLAVLKSEGWNAPPRQAGELIERGRKLSALRKRAEERFTPDALMQDHAPDVAFIEEKERGTFRFLNFLSGRFRQVKRRWLSYRLPSYRASLLEQAEEMKRIDELRAEAAWLSSRGAEAMGLFGEKWEGEHTDWDALDAYVRWVVELRALTVVHHLPGRAAEVASSPNPSLPLATSLREAVDRTAKALGELRTLGGWPSDYLDTMPLAGVAARFQAMEEGIALAPRWAAFELVRQQVAAGAAAEALAPALAGQVAWADLSRAFRRAFHQKWVSAAVQEREPLRAFATLPHEQRVAEFRRLDRQVLQENRDRLVAQLRERVQAGLRESAAAAQMPYLQGQMARQRAHAPLRTTMQRAGTAIRAIKPCFMMSPLTVAQLLDGGAPAFDLVIFDEASQLPPEDAVGAIVRGASLVVVGDPNQLPPTNFFSVMAGQAAAPLAEDGTPLFEDSESILEEFMGAGVPKTRLKWHYRSTHESLITFSNVSFYDADLFTFPSVETDSHARGLVFEHVEGGVYEGKGINPIEARRVVDAVVRHAREHPDVSLGVGTFNLRQQLLIQDEIEARRRQEPGIDAFFSRERDEPFFVKNLENIQGDERDVIFLSVTYAKGKDGKLRYNFGPINGENGWRRLNVLTTRARQRMVVFSSMRGDDINPASAGTRGPLLLRDFLLYAERGHLDAPRPDAETEAGALFEREVAAELERRGLRIQTKVGVAGYRIDIGVLDDELPGRFVCGVECDGASYRDAQTARDRDRLRAQVLGERGWEIHRVWSVDWFKDQGGQVERLVRLIEESRVRAKEKAEADAAAASAESAPSSSSDQPTSDPSSQSDQPSSEPQPIAALASSDAADAADAPPVEPDDDDPLAAEPYRMADDSVRHRNAELSAAPLNHLFQAIGDVLAAEAPVHVDDLADRVAAMWGLSRAGSRATARIEAALKDAENVGRLQRRGDFVWRADGAFAVRSRAGTKIPAERIAPEEYREATLRVLRATGGLPRKELVARVRALLGFSRTGARLEEAAGAAIDALLAEGIAGEGSTGIRLRD
jgi:very-short-patch-repair endonuclease